MPIKEIADQKTWNDFLLGLKPNTFLQSWQWGQVQKNMGESVRYLGLFAGGEQIGAALVIIVNARRGRHYLIPHLLPAAWTKDALSELIEYLKASAKQDRAVALRIAPLFKNTPASRRLFAELGFRSAPLHVHAELTWLLDINKSEADLLAGMRKTTRHAIRKAEQAGVTLQIITDPTETLARFWPLYQETRSRHGFILWSQAMIRSQLEIFAAGQRIFTVIARYNNQDIAAAVIFIFGTTAFYYHGASQKMPSAIPAAQLLQLGSIREARRRGLTRYNFWGIAPENQLRHPFAGITVFKKGFGGYAINYLHAQDLPLSLKYWRLWAVDTYRKYHRGF